MIGWRIRVMNQDAEKYLERNRNLNRGYRKLEVWREAIELFSFVKKKLKTITELSFKLKHKLKIPHCLFLPILLRGAAGDI